MDIIYFSCQMQWFHFPCRNDYARLYKLKTSVTHTCAPHLKVNTKISECIACKIENQWKQTWNIYKYIYIYIYIYILIRVTVCVLVYEVYQKINGFLPKWLAIGSSVCSRNFFKEISRHESFHELEECQHDLLYRPMRQEYLPES